VVPPTLTEVRDWIQVPASVLPDEQLQNVLDAESVLQAAYCNTDDAVYPANLHQALLRRCACAVAKRNLPLGYVATDFEFAPTRLLAYDPEIERLEAPDRWIPVA